MNTATCIIFIDTESILEGPWRGAFDFGRGMAVICATLSQHGVPAVFNACGKLLQEHPGLFRELEAGGHEIALHGWQHENLRMLDDPELDATLQRAHGAYRGAMGHAPKGFRAPWLEYDGRLTAWLSQNGYAWTSHRHLPFRERFTSPGLRPELRPGRRLASWWSALLEWRFSGAPRRIGRTLWDIPLTSSLDGELLGLVSTLQTSPQAAIDHCLAAWMAQAARHRTCFTLNLHDWLMATANRPELLAAVLAALRERGFRTITATRLLQELDADAG